MYKAIIFDFFNVVHRDPFQHWLKQHDLERSGDLHDSSRLLDVGGIDNDEFYKRLSKLTGKSAQSVREVYDDTRFIDTEVVALIKRLKKSYKTGLLSNSSADYLGHILEEHRLKPLFDVITISSDVRLIKPDLRIFQYILDKLGVTANEAIFIDDNPHNTEAAARIGLTAIVFKDVGSLQQQLTNLRVTT